MQLVVGKFCDCVKLERFYLVKPIALLSSRSQLTNEPNIGQKISSIRMRNLFQMSLENLEPLFSEDVGLALYSLSLRWPSYLEI